MMKRARVQRFVAEHWMFWAMELLVLGVIASVTIAESRSASRQVQGMLNHIESYFAIDPSDASSHVPVGQLETPPQPLPAEGGVAHPGEFPDEMSRTPDRF